MSASEILLEDGLSFQATLQQDLVETLKQELLETEKSVLKHNEELDKRIQQNALLWPQQGVSRKTAKDPKDKPSDNFKSVSPAWKSCPSKKTSQPCSRTQQCEQLPSCTQLMKEREDEVECQKQFWAHPVPSHVHQPRYHKMMAQREKERKHDIEQRKQFLLSIQKPFKFQEREKDKSKMLSTINQVPHDGVNKPGSVTKPPKEVLDSSSKVKAATTKSSSLSCGPKLHTAERSRKEKLESLYDTPSFKPQINQQVPDFNKLHKILQKEYLRRPQSADGTKCQPFYLRTSDLPARKHNISLENSEVPKTVHLSRATSLGALTSLSTATLPIFTTDAVKKRNMAIRQSMEMRDKKNRESADWLRTFNRRSQALKWSSALHAKLPDQKDVHKEKLQQHRLTDQQKMREYARELRDMRDRVRERPYLFEQVKQKNARAQAEQVFRNKLKKNGITERFIQQHGGGNEESSSSRSYDNTHESDSGSSREENVDDWEKIEDVKERSVKSKGEELQ
ncbi:protein FAM161B isoform X1 [Takifugu flavidus]|uniref:protein FAM161B isoform X1 n=1 Tax=Takifugu flavidus TaxID=433684 RepID=UPI0025440B21|nr:protein FAM161B isoform X1 [Takifugu flavidus]